MKKKMYVLGVAALVAAMLAMSGAAQSAMWVGAELGGNMNAYPNITVSGPNGGSFSRTTEVRPSVIGGVTIGYDFVNSGFGAYAYPDWMKYFSFAVDYTYNRLTIQDGGPGIGSAFAGNSRLNGTESALTFLFMFHYGFMPDSEVPTGRINPYLGIGPAVVFTGVQGSLPVLTATTYNIKTHVVTVVDRPRSSNFGDNAVNVALVVEPGVRFMVMKNVSVDVAMRYRYSAPSYGDNVTIRTTLNQFAPLVRASIHF
jgi:opacity protein-like surface antigen